MLTAERLREALTYDSVTGVFTWIKPPSWRVKIGDVAGSLASIGYVYIKLDNYKYLAHRLAWFYVHGIWPVDQIDHINGDRANNKIINLRSVSRSVNLQNQRQARSHNSTGFLGVSPHRKKFAARIGVDGKYTYLGSFNTPELAHAAYVDAKRALHPGNTL
jgi:hypothetical protein